MKISYLELLEMIKEGKQPRKVKFNESVYEWRNAMYAKLYEKALNPLLVEEHTDDFLAKVKCIEVVQEILDEKEKEYLSAVIKPFRNEVLWIKKLDYRDGEYIKLRTFNTNMVFPDFEKGTMYKVMQYDV